MTNDRWSSGDAYEGYIGRWSRSVADEFLAWLDVAPGARWADVGCGTGALTEAILRLARPASVVGVEPSAAFVAHARERVPGAEFRAGDAEATGLDGGSVDALVSGLVLNFVPRPEAAVAEARRVVAPGGTVGAYVWDYGGEMWMLRHFWDAAFALDPAARELDEAPRFPLCRPDALAALFGPGAEVTGITVPTTFRDFDDYWTPFLGGTGPAPSYVASLDPPRRDALRDALRERLPAGAGGTLALTARAWAVRVRVT